MNENTLNRLLKGANQLHESNKQKKLADKIHITDIAQLSGDNSYRTFGGDYSKPFKMKFKIRVFDCDMNEEMNKPMPEGSFEFKGEGTSYYAVSKKKSSRFRRFVDWVKTKAGF